MLQNMNVVQDGAAYTALTNLTREVVYSSPHAGAAVQEDTHSFKNNIVGSSVNFFAGAAVRSAGQETIARDNIAHAEQPYHDMQTAICAQRKAQSFDPGLTERFIAAQIQRDEQ